MSQEKWNISSLENAIVRPRMNTTIGNRTFESYEPILMFDGADIEVMSITGEQRSSQGGKTGAKLIAWNRIQNLNVVLSKGKLSDIGMNLLMNSVAAEYIAGAAYYINTTETHQLDGSGQCELDYTPYVAVQQKMFAYDLNSGLEMDKKDVTVISGNRIEVAGGAGLVVSINYYYDYNGAVKEILVQQGSFSGTYLIEGKTIAVDDDGNKRSVFIVFPKVSITSGLTIRLGSAQSPSYASFEFTVLEDTYLGVKTPMYYVLLDDEVD